MTILIVFSPPLIWTPGHYLDEILLSTQAQGRASRSPEPADFVISLSDDARVLLDEASLTSADNIEGMDPDMIAMARDLHSPLVRVGGNFTSAYDWHDGIGARDRRVSKINVSWGIPEYNTFGTDEFLAFCQLINAQPQIALNLGTDMS